jgi:hypothetical protein
VRGLFKELYLQEIGYAILTSLCILQNNSYIFSGLLEFFSIQEFSRGLSTSYGNHNNNILLAFP